MSKPNLRERALFLLSPQKGNRAYENRMRKEIDDGSTLNRVGYLQRWEKR